MNSSLTELYDYDALRNEPVATMFVTRPPRETLVLGSAQSLDLLDLTRAQEVVLRRRRGGGGLVLLQPGDLWIDWWIPANDARWRSDVHASSRMAGQWWADVLHDIVDGDVTVHDGPLEGDRDFRLVCFAGRGPGEVFIDAKKAVGVTQWRVREGIFLSTVMHARASNRILGYLQDVPIGLDRALEHQLLPGLIDVDVESLTGALRRASGPWSPGVNALLA